MKDTEILETIVVEVSRDGENGKGTGFYISEDEVATCYHVLVPDGQKPRRNKTYWIKNDVWDGGWQKAKLVRYRPLPDDIAVLKTSRRLESFDANLLKPWNRENCAFQSRGYSEETSAAGFGANDIDGRIINNTTLENRARLLLHTKPEAITPGRSGSPVFSTAQRAIVGMIDYQGGELHRDAQIGAAIPIEAIAPNIESPGKCRLVVGVPELPANFLARPSDLKELKDALISSEHSTTAITSPRSEHLAQAAASLKLGVFGMGGIGKSVLAAAAARDDEVQSHFSGGVFWLTLGIEPKIVQKQADLAKMIDCQPHAFESTAEGRTVLDRLLASNACLLILDDIWSAADVQELIGNLGLQSRMLITTRDARIITALAAKEYPLGLLSEEESRELLARWAGLDEALLPPEAAEVIHQCGRLPLALALCGAQIRDGISWSDLLEALQEADLEFLDHEQSSVMKSLKVSVDRLMQKERECYLELAVFPPDETIPEAAILTLWAHAQKLKKRDGRRLLAVLDRRSLLKRNIEHDNSIIEMHDLQHDFLRASCSDLQALHNLILDAYRPLEGGWRSGPDDGYFFQHLAYHLSQAGKRDELRSLLLDFDWMQAKLVATDVPSLLSDYDQISSEEDLSLVQGAIRLSAHVLFRDPKQLPSQLAGRLLGIQIHSIKSLIEQIPLKVSYPWLRPLAGSLTPSGGPLIRTFQGHEGPVNAVAISSDGRLALSGSDDNTLKLWDLETGREIRTLKGHDGRVSAVALSSDGRLALSGSDDNTLKLWDLETGREVRTFLGHAGVVSALSSDGRLALSGSEDNTLKLWDLEAGRVVKILQGHAGGIIAVAMSSDGRLALSGSIDNALKLWDLETGREVRMLKGHDGPVWAVALSSDGRLALSGSLDNTLKLWDIETSQLIWTLEGHADWVTTVAISSDGRLALSGSRDNTLKIWDLETGREVKTLRGHADSIWALSLSSDGRHVLSGSNDNTLKLWDVVIGRETGTLKGHNGPVIAIAISSDGYLALSGSRDNTLKLWDFETGHEVETLYGHYDPVSAVVLSSNKQFALSGSFDETLKLWDLRTGREIRTLKGHIGPVVTVALSSDGLHALSGSLDGTLKLWNLETGREFRTLRGHYGWVSSVTLASGCLHALWGSYDNTLKLWDLEMDLKIEREIRTLKGHAGVYAVALSSNGRSALSGSFDHTLKFWNLETGREVRTLNGHAGPIYAVALSSDGRSALSGSYDNTLKFWDLETGKIIAEFSAEGPITAVALAENGRIAAGESSGRVHFLNLEKAKASDRRH